MSKESMLKITSPEAKAKRELSAIKRGVEVRRIQARMMATKIAWPEPLPQHKKKERDEYIKLHNLPF